MICAHIIALVILIISCVCQLFDVAASTKNGGNEESRRRTFCAVTSFVGPEYVRKKLSGWTEIPVAQIIDGSKSVDFFYYDGKARDDHPKQYYNLRADVRHWIDNPDIWDKAKLHRELSIRAPNIICKTILYEKLGRLPPGVWMIRSNMGSVGSKSRAVDNQADFVKTYKEFMKRRTSRDVIMASEYIVDPLLVNERKFHLRCYIIASVSGHGSNVARKAWFVKHGVMIPAAHEYVAGDWKNAAVHDSHGHENPHIKYFPAEFTRAGDFSMEELTKKCADILHEAFTVFLPKAKNYPETGRIGYEIYGADIMFTATGDAKLIEINAGPTIFPGVSQKVFDAVLGTVFTDAFYPAGDPDAVIKLV